MARQTQLQEKYMVRMIQLAELKGGSKVKGRKGIIWTASMFIILGMLLIDPYRAASASH